MFSIASVWFLQLRGPVRLFSLEEKERVQRGSPMASTFAEQISFVWEFALKSFAFTELLPQFMTKMNILFLGFSGLKGYR